MGQLGIVTWAVAYKVSYIPLDVFLLSCNQPQYSFMRKRLSSIYASKDIRNVDTSERYRQVV